MITKKIIGIIIILILVLMLYFSFGPKVVAGKVVDSQGNGIQGVNVRAWQRGFGFSNGSLVWDKDFFYYAKTDSDGNFRMVYYRGGDTSVHLQIYKGDYESNIKNVKDIYINFWEHPTIKING